MTEAVFDFAAINRRLNRKPEPVAATIADWLTPRSGNNEVLAALRAEVEQMERELDAREAITQNKANG